MGWGSLGDVSDCGGFVLHCLEMRPMKEWETLFCRAVADVRFVINNDFGRGDHVKSDRRGTSVPELRCGVSLAFEATGR